MSNTNTLPKLMYRYIKAKK